MTLTLRAVSLNDDPLTQPITVHFDAAGGSIGRADHNTMALPDPKRHISRRQAEVQARDGLFSIVNVGSANPIVVGTRTLARGEGATLAHGDRLRIGGYLLEVEVGAGASSEAVSITRGRAAVDAAAPASVRAPVPAPVAGSPFASFGIDGSPPLSAANPFAALLGDDATPTPAQPAWARLPDDFDPFAAPPVAAPAVSSSPAAGPPDAFADLIPGAEPASIDRLFGLEPVAGRDRLEEFMAGAALSPRDGAAAAAPLSADPLALFGAAASRAREAPVEPARTASDHAPDWQAAFAPPRPVRPAAPPAPSPAAASPGQPDVGLSATAWAAFCDGAGVAIDRPAEADTETMRQIGVLLRTSIEGTLRLMAVRASAKHELRASVTVIQSQRNNPLKFSPDANAALEQLLQPPLRGFLPGPAAVADAMDDLVGHAIGSIAGTRAALEGVLDRFAPRQLESKLAGRSVLDSVLPMNRKARLWELYLQHFEAIRSEAQDDFHSLFGRAFLAAYEQQLEDLQRNDAGAAPVPRTG